MLNSEQEVLNRYSVLITVMFILLYHYVVLEYYFFFGC